MTEHTPKQNTDVDSTRRQFLKKIGFGAVAGGMAAPLLDDARAATTGRKVKYRTLGKTGLQISEIGIGGHSWAYKRVPDGKGGLRRPTIDEAVRMIGKSIDMGVNFLDSCTALEESSTPGEALKRMRARDKVLVSIRVSHKMKGIKADKQEIYKWTEDRLKLWQTDYVDFCLLCNT
ncbi:MAG: aldo/keto reductase, partial [Planctomycetota bacterium]